MSNIRRSNNSTNNDVEIFNMELIEKRNFSTMSIKEAVESFKKKYPIPNQKIWTIGVDEINKVIYYYTSDPKAVWVDVPATHEGYALEMVVSSKPRSSSNNG